MMRAILVATLFFLGLLSLQQSISGPAESPLERGFQDAVQPFLKTYCTSCHAGTKPKGDLDLSRYGTPHAVASDWRRWETVLEQLEAQRMPPAKAKEQPSAEQRRQIAGWIRDMRKQEARRTAGDPGPMPPRRLSNVEYDYTIRDLTGVDIRPAREFPVDPTNEAGFDNSAESLAMSPAYLNKYLEAARHVSDHLIFLPDGLIFAPYPVIADTDRDKFSVRRIIDFYRRQRTDYADYFEAAWRYQHRAALGRPEGSLTDVARQAGISARYLALIWSTLTEPAEAVGPGAALRLLWQELPSPGADAKSGRPGCEKMRDFVVALRQMLVPDVKNLSAPPMQNGSQPLVLWKNRQWVANRMRYAGGAPSLHLDELALPEAARLAVTVPSDAESVKYYEAAFARFCRTFPDAFYVSERARVYLNPEKEKKLGGRLLSAGFHSMTGYFRDDGPLYELVLSNGEQKELDRLWLEFDVITGAPMRQHTSFIWFERTDSRFMRDPDFDFARAEDKDSTSAAKIKQLAEVYLAKAIRMEASEVARQAIKDHFDIISASIRRVEQTRLDAEPGHLKALQTLAEKAYRRPLTALERDHVAAFYHELRGKDGLSHEDAVRDTLVRVLMSPHFLYRSLPPAKPVSQTASGTRPARAGSLQLQPLSAYELASACGVPYLERSRSPLGFVPA